MWRLIFRVRALLLPVVSVAAAAALPLGSATAKNNNYSAAHPPCGVSRVERVGPTSIRLYLLPSRSRAIDLVHAGDKQEIGPSVVGPVILAQLGDKITSRYATAVPRCSMTVRTTREGIGLEIQDKDQLSWPPDTFFFPAR